MAGVIGITKAWWDSLRGASHAPTGANTLVTENRLAEIELTPGPPGADGDPGPPGAAGPNDNLDGDPVELAGVADNDFLQRVSGVWVPRSASQVATEVGVDGKVSKSGDTIDGDLIVTGQVSASVGVVDDLSSTEFSTINANARTLSGLARFTPATDFVYTSQTGTMFGAHDAVTTTIRLNGVNSWNAPHYPKSIHIRDGFADDEYVVLTEPPTMETSTRGRFDNCVRGKPIGGGVGKVHAASAAYRTTDNNAHMHGYVLPTVETDANAPLVLVFGIATVTDAHDPTNVDMFLPPAATTAGWPALVNSAIYMVALRGGHATKPIRLIDPFSGSVVAQFTAGTDRKGAILVYEKLTGLWLPLAQPAGGTSA